MYGFTQIKCDGPIIGPTCGRVISKVWFARVQVPVHTVFVNISMGR